MTLDAAVDLITKNPAGSLRFRAEQHVLAFHTTPQQLVLYTAEYTGPPAVLKCFMWWTWCWEKRLPLIRVHQS